MISTDKLVFLQLQKTGCTHIEYLLKNLFPTCVVGSKHYRMTGIDSSDQRHIVGTVRNPWDWYVSLWAYGCGRKGGQYIRTTRNMSIPKVILDSRVRDFVGPYARLSRLLERVKCEVTRPSARWVELFADSSNPKAFRDWLRLTLDSRRRFDGFQDYGLSAISTFAGLFTYLYEVLYLNDAGRLYGRSAISTIGELKSYDKESNILDYVVRMEHLEDDFISALRASGYALTDDQLKVIRGSKKTNTSRRRFQIEDYYDAETTELVRERESLLIDKHKYSFPSVAHESELLNPR